MTQIYNFNNYLTDKNKNILNGFSNALTYNINITDQSLTFELIRAKSGTETQDVVLYNFSLALSTLQSHTRLHDHSFWSIKSLIRKPAEQEILGAESLDPIFDVTRNYKLVPMFNSVELRSQFDFPFRIFVPSKTSTFSQCVFYVGDFKGVTPTDGSSTPWNNTITVNVNSPNVFTNGYRDVPFLFGSITSSTSLQSVSAGTTIPVTVNCSDTTVSKLYLEPICGIVDRTEVIMTNGTGKFNVITNTLTAGETVEVKIGYKTYSDRNKFTQVLS
jgi:hypothetical protein